MIERRRYMGLTALPYDYEVEYLESSGTQWIDTGVPNNQLDWMLFDFTNTGHAGFLGVNGTTQVGTYDARYGTNSDGRWVVIETLVNSQWRAVNQNNSTIYNNNRTPDADSNYLFALHMQPHHGASYFFEGYLHRYQSKKDGVFVQDFICVVKNGTPCIYDKVSGDFFYNQGTGNFIAGPRVAGGVNT